jgi:hypothetical protein
VTDEIGSDLEYGSKSLDEVSKEMPKSVEVSNHPTTITMMITFVSFSLLYTLHYK